MGRMIRLAAAVMVAGLLVSAAPAWSQDTGDTPSSPGWREHLTLNGYLRNETAWRLNQPAGLVKVLNIVNLEPRYTFGPRAQLSARVRGYYDAAYDLVDIDTISPRKGPESILTSEIDTGPEVNAVTIDNIRNVEIRKTGAELREFYLDVHFRVLDIRAGRQIVRWGVVEGARVTDEINPLDFHEFILREVNDRYIPLWMLKADLYMGETTLEGLWIPDLRTHEPAARESEFEQFRFLPGMKRPAQTVHNSEWALKLSRLIGGWDLSASYFSTWDDFPIAFRTVESPSQFNNRTEVTFKPRVGRLEIFGATVSTALGRLILNAEAAWVQDKLFGTILSRFTRTDGTNVLQLGEVQKDYLKYAVGVDGTLLGAEWSAQVLQHRIPDWEPNMIQDQVDTVYGAFVRKGLLHDRLVVQALVLLFRNDREWLVRPRMEYGLTQRVKLSVGADLLHGAISDAKPGEEPLPGQFHFVGFFTNHSRVYSELQYSF
ncbi:MAG: DUF1302 family protein [Nitrospirota bacterium]